MKYKNKRKWVGSHEKNQNTAIICSNYDFQCEFVGEWLGIWVGRWAYCADECVEYFDKEWKASF